MDEEQEIIVQELIDRVHGLMGRYSELKEQYNLLSHENEDLRHQIEEQNIKIDRLEQQYNSAKIATNVLAPVEDKDEARAQLNRIVREIDNCIALLNR